MKLNGYCLYKACVTWVRMGLFLLTAAVTTPVVVQADEPDSLKALEAAVEQSPKDGDARVRLGYAYLTAGDLKRATKAFKKGIRYAKSAEAYNGLGVVYSQQKAWQRKAFFYFRRALGVDPTFVEAQMNIARLHVRMGDPDAGKAFERAIQIDSTYARAYLELADWYADGEYEEHLADVYTRYIALYPDDVEGPYGLALLYTKQKRYGQALKISELLMEKYPDDPRWLALTAQAYAARGDADKALDLFLLYLWMLPDEERVLYEDLSLVAFPEEQKAYQAAEDREAFLEAFWRKRDLTLVSGGKARRAEHYRRVWYARTHFAKVVQPWDRRGEVYIRYGEPDYRSRSGKANPLPGLAVEAVKERNAYELPPVSTVDMRDITREQFFARQPTGGSAKLLGTQALIEPIYPPDPDPNIPQSREIFPWESWVYTGIGGGVEFVFVDRVMNGRFDFPPPPGGIGIPLRALAALTRFHPAVVLQNVVSETPEYFDLPPGMEPLEFYYDLASFRGEAGKTVVEVYFGIPLEHVGVREEEGGTQIQVDRAVALVDLHGEDAYRIQEELTFAGQAPSTARAGAFVPDVTSLEVPPGKYRLAVRLVDRSSGKWGVYLQEVEIPAFGDTLAMSDLELAWVVSSKRQAEKFRKGEVWVVPMPSRSYRRDQSAYVYYEVYNLQKDEFGQTRYRVDYAIRRDVRRSAALFGGIASAFDWVFSDKKPEVMVSYERTGTDSSEPIYFELDTNKLKPGLNQIEVTVTDLNGGDTVSKKAIFRLDRETRGSGD